MGSIRRQADYGMANLRTAAWQTRPAIPQDGQRSHRLHKNFPNIPGLRLSAASKMRRAPGMPL
jgi:hypothetical protein